MNRARLSFVMAAVCLPLMLGACRFGRAAAVAEPAPTLPDIPVYVIAPSDSAPLALAPTRSRDPIGELGADRIVSLTANNAEARTLLLWLAQEAGVNIVIAPDVTARVSVNFNGVRAGDAMRAIMAQAGLAVLAPAAHSPWPPVVFFQRPVNINESDPEAIMTRFGVSLEMAKWIVESRTRP